MEQETTMTNRNDMIDTGERAERLNEIYEQFRDLLDEARDLVRGTREEDRANAYWLAHIRCALDEDHDYLSRGMCTMQDSIEALDAQAADEEEAA
jgi:hypothetical protein